MSQLAERDDADEDQADDEHRRDHLLALLGGRLGRQREEVSEKRHRGPTLTDQAPVSLEGALDRLGAAAGPCVPRLGPFAERRRCRRPGLAVARKLVGAELRADGDQCGEVGHGLDLPRLGDPHQAVRIEVVAEQERRVLVRGSEQARPPEMEEVALVDRLEPEAVPLLGERRKDRLQLTLALGAQGLGPERALTSRLLDDRLPGMRGYNQVASSFVQ